MCAASGPGASDQVAKIPQAWQGLFHVLSAQQRALLAAESWFRKRFDSNTGQEWLSWTDLMGALIEEEPQVKDNKLIFKPRVLHFRDHLQKLLLAFLYHHRHEIPDHDLEKFVKVMKDHDSTDHWIKFLVGKLGDGLPITDSQKPKPWTGYKFSAAMESQMRTLVSKIREADSSQASGNPWGTNIVSKGTWYSPQRTVDKDIPLSVPGAIDVDTPSVGPSHTPHMEGVPSGEDTPKKRLKLDESQIDLVEKSGPASTGPDLSLQNDISELKELWHSGTADPDVAPHDLKKLLGRTPDQMRVMIDHMELSSLSEVSMVTACQHVASIAEELSHTNAVCFAQACILPKVMSLTQPASRLLLGAVTIFARHFPKQTIEGVLVPSTNSSQSGGAQADLVVRILREPFTVQHRTDFLSHLVDCGGVWTEPVLTAVQTLVDMKSPLTTQILSGVVTSLQASGLAMSDNLKFAKLTLAVINKYGKQFTPADITAFRHVLDVNKTFLKKSATAALNKLTV